MIVGAIEHVKNPLMVLLGDTHTIIPDGDTAVAAVFPHANFYPSVIPAVIVKFDRVGKQIGEHGADPVFIRFPFKLFLDFLFPFNIFAKLTKRKSSLQEAGKHW